MKQQQMIYQQFGTPESVKWIENIANTQQTAYIKSKKLNQIPKKLPKQFETINSDGLHLLTQLLQIIPDLRCYVFILSVSN